MARVILKTSPLPTCFKLKPQQLPLADLLEERDGPPLKPHQWSDPLQHAHVLKTGEVDIEIPEETPTQRRGWHYRWRYRLVSTHLTIEVLYLFGETWCFAGSFHFDGQPSWTTRSFRHLAEMFGFEELRQLAEDAGQY